MPFGALLHARELPAPIALEAAGPFVHGSDPLGIGAIERLLAVAPHVDEWLVSGIEGPRGTDPARMCAELANAGVRESVTACESVVSAYHVACKEAAQNDRIIVFGSFHTVAAVMAASSTH